MDGEEGENHPTKGAEIANVLLDHNFHMGTGELPRDDKWLTKSKEIEWEYYYLVLRHSRSMAKRYNKEPSKLCWADKLSIKYDPWFLYIPRAMLSGELKEHRERADKFGELTFNKSNREWYQWAHDRMICKAYNKDITPPYEGH
jgi:hypothetical protein